MRRIDTNVVKITGPRWWSADNLHDDPIEVEDDNPTVSPTIPFEASVAPTALDSGNSMEVDLEIKRRRDGPADSTSKRVKGAGKGKAKKLTGGQPGPGGSSLLDTGGQGDCGWRALSFMLSDLNTRKSPNDIIDKIEVISKTLRAKTISHLIQARPVWEPFFAVDPKWNNVSEGGAPATDVASFLQVIQRPLRWICGLSLAAVAQLQRVNIVVFSFDSEADDFKVIARFKGSESWQQLSIIPVVLDAGHYFALRKGPKGNKWPKEWMTHGESPCSQEYELGGTDQVVRGGGNDGELVHEESLQTPKRRLDLDDTDDWLRTCSVGRSSTVSSIGRRIHGKQSVSSCKPESNSKGDSRVALGNLEERTRDDNGYQENDRAGNHASSTRLLQIGGSEGTREVQRHEDLGPRVLKGITNWKCPVCEEVLKIDRDAHADRCAITKHMQKFHKQIWMDDRNKNMVWGRTKSSFCLNPVVKPLDFVQIKEEDRLKEAEFICPFCDMCLPKLGLHGKKASFLASLSKKKHLRVDCEAKAGLPPMDLKQYNMLFLRKFPMFSRKGTDSLMATTARRMEARMEYARSRGHTPLLCFLDFKAVGLRGTCTVVCKVCRCDLGTNGRKRFHDACSGSFMPEYNQTGPSVKFWMAARRENQIEQMQKSLEIDDEELKKTLAAVDAAVENENQTKTKPKQNKRKRAATLSCSDPQL